MGHELYRMVMDGARPGWTPAMVLVALVIADDARDPSSGMPDDGGWPWSAIPVEGCWRKGKWRDGIAEQTGLAPRTISRALAGLAKAGYEMREPVMDRHGKPVMDRHGKPVFAARGHAMRFRVPPLRPRDPVDNSAAGRPGNSQRSPDMASFDPKGRQICPQRSPDMASPSPQSPPQRPSPLRDANTSPYGADVEGGTPGNTRRKMISSGDGDQPPPRPYRAGDGSPQQRDQEAELRRQQDALSAWIAAHPNPDGSTP